jgi:hypothetical protein
MDGSSMNHGLMKKVQFLDLRKQAKMQWLQDPNQSNLDNVNSARSEANRHFREKRENI